MTTAESILEKLRLPTNAPDTVDRLCRALPDCEPLLVRAALDDLAAAGQVVWLESTGDVYLPHRSEVGVTD